jgi:chromosome segregation ATPase
MDLGGWIQLGIAAASGSALWKLGGLAKRRLIRDPKPAAEARKINAEASRMEWGTLRDEIDRLSELVKRQGREIADLRDRDDKRSDREAALEHENKLLRTQVGRLRRRVEGLEKILKVEVKITPEMQRLLDELPDDSDDAGSADASD